MPRRCASNIVVCVAAPVRPLQTSTPPTVMQKPAPAAQARVQTPQVLSRFVDEINCKIFSVEKTTVNLIKRYNIW